MASKTPKPRQPGKPGTKSAGKPKPGDGLMGWLGRQVGHVKQAVQTDVTKPAKPKKSGVQAKARESGTPTGSTSSARSPQANSPHAGSTQRQSAKSPPGATATRATAV